MHSSNLSDFLKKVFSPSIYTYTEFPLIDQDPLTIYRNISKGKPSFLLEVTEGPHYSYVGTDPILTLETRDHVTTINIIGKVFISDKHPFTLLREILSFLPNTPLIGFMAYEAARYFEKLPQPKESPQCPDFYFALHKNSYTFDHTSQLIQHHSFNLPSSSSMYCCNVTTNREPPQMYRCNVTEEQYIEGVAKAKEFIEAGDAFQIVLSREYTVDHSINPLALFQQLRDTAPTPFLYLFESDKFSFVGATPERLVQVKEGVVETMPIAGTRGRGAFKTDAELENDLLSDPKENAEHMMLVDLGRNDIGSISEPGTVVISELKTIRHFPKITHLVSKVQGVLQSDMDALDAIRATFPAGTLTGAPKIRAMEIIHQIETKRRGLYGGAVIFLKSRMECDSFIAIRTAFFNENSATVRTGAGIVYDSNPQKELEETQHKACTILDALLNHAQTLRRNVTAVQGGE